jgi:hypothetical protein
VHANSPSPELALEFAPPIHSAIWVFKTLSRDRSLSNGSDEVGNRNPDAGTTIAALDYRRWKVAQLRSVDRSSDRRLRKASY